MKFYLSSYRIGDKSQELVKLVGKNKLTAVIPNALDFSTDLERRKASVAREINELKQLGFDPEEVNLKGYFGNQSKTGDDLDKFGLVWVMGGNAFILRKAMKNSGMDTWLQLQKQEGNNSLVYGGYSAGVCVLAPELNGLEIVDDPVMIAEGYDSEIVWKGVALLDWAFAPHYKSDHPESLIVEKLVDFYIENKILFKALKDGEVVIETS